MDRSEFERQLFEFGNLAHLPIEHLFDHRVRMPRDLSEQLLDRGEAAICEHLRNMLCSQHSQGPDLVAEAVGLQPDEDSFLLARAGHSHANFVRLCLAGRHGEAVAVLRGEAHEDATKLRRILVKTAIYFAALELQLIGVRLRAISDFHFGVVNSDTTDTMGALVKDARQLVASIKKAQTGVLSDEKLKGRRPDLIRQLKPYAEQIYERTLAARPGLTNVELTGELRQLFTSIAPNIEAADAGLDKILSGGEWGDEDPEVEQNGSSTSGLRQRISTALAGGVPGGEQLAFASLRLHAFAWHLPKIDFLESPLPRRRDKWFGRLAGGKNKQVAKLVLVSRSAVWAARQNPSAYAMNGDQLDIRWSLARWAREGRIPSEDVVLAAKDKIPSWKNELQSGALGVLVGCQRWDIHPDYRFATEDLRPAAAKTHFQSRKGFEQRPHAPSPQYRAPRASHRPC